MRRADFGFIVALLFILVFSTCAEGQTASTSQLIFRCASGSRLSSSTAGATETILFQRCSDGKFLRSTAGAAYAEIGSGTVTSVALSAPTGISVAGSPITTSGTLALSWDSQAASNFLASPSGSSGAPTFRVITTADVPAEFMTLTESNALYALKAGDTFTGNVNVPSLFGTSSIGAGTTTPCTLTSGASLTGTCVQVRSATGVGRAIASGQSSATYEMEDSGFATANQHVFQQLWNDGVWTWRAMNDNGSVRTTGPNWNTLTNVFTAANLTVTGTCTGCTGTGDVNGVGTWASRPAGGVNAGNTYQSTDAPYMQIDDGAALVYFGPRYRFFLPVLGDFSWINQGTATAEQTNGPVWMQGPGSGAWALRALVKTAPATPYTITIAIQAQFLADTQYGGFAWRESSSGKLVTCHYSQRPGFNGFYAANWTDANTHSADIASMTEPDSVYSGNRAGVNWIRAVDDGTNRKCSWSVDGIHFYEWYSAGSTTHMTANQVGFMLGNEVVSSTVQMNLYSWLQQ